MNRHARHVTSQGSGNRPEPQTVAARAHELWVSCGEPVVQDDAIWREAEHELLTEQQHQHCTSATHPQRRSR